MYDSLLACRRNLVKASPPEYLTLPVNGEPYITKNNIAIQQPWCVNLTLNDILNSDSNFKKIEDYPSYKKASFFKNIAIENAVGDFMTCCQYTCSKTREGCLRVIGAESRNFNAYGRIVHKKARGCSIFYKLLSYEDKKDGLDSAS